MSELKRLGARSTNLIDRQETIDRFNVIRPVDPKKDEYTKGIDVGIAMCIVAVKDQPTIQTEKAQLSQEGTTSDLIRKFIDGLEETFAHIREREGGDSVCGLCEYDGAYIGESGDWCNECPGFNRDDCFKLSDETRRKWTDEIIKALPSVQPEPKEGHWIGSDGSYVCSECGGDPIDFIATMGASFDAYIETPMNYCPNCGSYNGGGRK